jgi:hypothetical protein
MRSPYDRRMYLVCQHRMALARTSAGERGFEERTFECSTCGRMEKISVAVDPLFKMAPKLIAVCTENLNSDVVMMKSAEYRVRTDDSSPLNRAMDRRIFIQ